MRALPPSGFAAFAAHPGATGSPDAAMARVSQPVRSSGRETGSGASKTEACFQPKCRALERGSETKPRALSEPTEPDAGRLSAAHSAERAPLPALEPFALRLDGISRRIAQKQVLSDLSLDLPARGLTVVLGRRGAGRSTLAAIATGQRLPDRGRVSRAGMVAPGIGAAHGFGLTGMVERDLALRAASAGLDSASYCAAVAALLPEPEALSLPFRRAGAGTRGILLFAAAYIVPAALYVADGPLLPSSPSEADAVAPLLERARREAAVLWLSAGVSQLRAMAPERILLLEDGRLRALSGLEEAIAVFQPRTHAARPVKASATTPGAPGP